MISTLYSNIIVWLAILSLIRITYQIRDEKTKCYKAWESALGLTIYWLHYISNINVLIGLRSAATTKKAPSKLFFPSFFGLTIIDYLSYIGNDYDTVMFMF